MKEKFLEGLEENYKKHAEKLKKQEEDKWIDPDDDGSVKAPKYDIVYSYPVDLGDYWNNEI